jgi:hypothetical protein
MSEARLSIPGHPICQGLIKGSEWSRSYQVPRFSKEESMAYFGESIVARIVWCQQQKERVDVEPEREGWSAEEAGLQDALLNNDRTNNYRACPPEVFDRYVTGLQDGRALIRVAAIQHYYASVPQLR